MLVRDRQGIPVHVPSVEEDGDTTVAPARIEGMSQHEEAKLMRGVWIAGVLVAVAVIVVLITSDALAVPFVGAHNVTLNQLNGVAADTQGVTVSFSQAVQINNFTFYVTADPATRCLILGNTSGNVILASTTNVSSGTCWFSPGYYVDASQPNYTLGTDKSDVGYRSEYGTASSIPRPDTIMSWLHGFYESAPYQGTTFFSVLTVGMNYTVAGDSPPLFEWFNGLSLSNTTIQLNWSSNGTINRVSLLRYAVVILNTTNTTDPYVLLDTGRTPCTSYDYSLRLENATGFAESNVTVVTDCNVAVITPITTGEAILYIGRYLLLVLIGLTIYVVGMSAQGRAGAVVGGMGLALLYLLPWFEELRIGLLALIFASVILAVAGKKR